MGAALAATTRRNLIRPAERLGIDPIAAAYRKIAIHEGRYPVERVRGDARRAGESGSIGTAGRDG
ncbi:hypothetical protein THSYN_16675 [Candidatus Thiodictyon syntrophicum]|uniref:Uncharacterized protein n=1 Tax=Candidatus Thiodictyon syntrophicum TaxID=1166950 RepID=A0A2K8UA03_9GAMM|nr:hypothetical protein THSYN_16675 [Candidatus Thiodictyon syntrophicum]